jgi:hypothetical protein
MKIEIGVDVMMKTFPTNNTLLHHVVSCVAIHQDRRKPNRWVNKITQKLIDCGITSIEELKSKINDDTLNKLFINVSMTMVCLDYMPLLLVDIVPISSAIRISVRAGPNNGGPDALSTV